MFAEILHARWQKIKQPFIATIIILVLFALIAFIVAAYEFGWGWTGFDGHIGPNIQQYQPSKTLWDWLQLLAILAIPVMVGFGAVWFSYRQNLTTSGIAVDRQREESLQAYLDKISELLLKEHLGDSARRGGVVPGHEEARKIARARTLTVLQGLDGKRKGSVLQFLHESGLIDRDKPIIHMKGADLSAANLSIADLSGANLKEADLSGANLTKADLNRANLSFSNLSIADLIGADLTGTDLSYANLNRANLSGASLSEANLSRADLSYANLSKSRRWPTMSTTQWQILQNANRRGLREQATCRWGWGPLSVFWGPSTRIIFKNGTNLSEVNLNRANLGGANLNDANLERANLKEADLSGANLTMANLKGADLTEAKMSRAERKVGVIRLQRPFLESWGDDPKWADLKKGYPFIEKELLSTPEEKNFLEGSDRNKARKIGVNLRKGHILKVVQLEAVAADLQEADLTGADLTGADLSGANLKDATGITTEELEKQAKSLQGTTMPGGTKQPW